MRRWVRYEAPVMVCVELDPDDPSSGTVVNVVLGEEEQDITLARDHRGTALVYDENMQRPQDPTPVDRHAITIAEHRQWPDQPDWEHGPDALRYPGLYDIDEPTDDQLDDDQHDDETNEDAATSPRPTRG